MVECSDASGGASTDASSRFDGSLAGPAFYTRSLLATIQVHFVGDVPSNI